MSEATGKQPAKQKRRQKRRRIKFQLPPNVTGIAIPSPYCGPMGPGAQPGTRFVNNGGKVLAKARVLLIFWGSYWSKIQPVGNPDPTVIRAGVEGIFMSPYMSALDQYGVSPATFWDPPEVRITNDDPPNPFSFQDVCNFIFRFIDHGPLPEPDAPLNKFPPQGTQLVYCVFMPPDATFSTPNVLGENGSVLWQDYDFPFDVDTDPCYLMWVGGTTNDDYTIVFSHELAEICTDPNGNSTGVVASPGTPGCPPDGDCQIGDVCTEICEMLPNAVKVQAYWSQRDNACVIPK